MNYSVQRAVSDGSMVLLPISIEYFDRSEITVVFDDGAGTYDWEWVGASDNSIAFPTAIPDGVEVLVRRETDMGELRHSFTGGAAFTEQSIDEAFTQVLHIAQEAKEGAVLGEIFQDVDMHGYKMVNVGDGVNPTDGASVGQLLDAVQDITEQVDTAVAAASTASAAAATSTSNAATAVAAKDEAVAAANSAEADAVSTAADALASANAQAAAVIARLAAEAAAVSAEGAASLAADFMQLYLGPKETPPTLNNEGGPLQVGMLYWDIFGSAMQVWNETSWVAAYVSAGDYVTVSGVQTLLNKTLTSPVVLANSTSPALSITQEGTGNCLTINDVGGDSTPIVVTATGLLINGHTASIPVSGAVTYSNIKDQVIGTSGDTSGSSNVQFAAVSAGVQQIYAKSRGTTIGAHVAVGNGETIGQTSWSGSDGTAFVTCATMIGAADGVPTAGVIPGRITFFTANAAGVLTETLRLSSGSIGIGGAGSVNIGLYNRKAIGGSAISYGMYNTGVIQEGVTTAYGIRTIPATAAATFTVSNVICNSVGFGSVGAGSSVSTVVGYSVESSMAVGVYSNYGFSSSIAAGSGKYNFYAGGTATNYFAGKTIVNSTLQTNADILEKVFTVVDGASVDLNPLNGTIQQWTLGASRSPTATAFVDGQSMTLMIADGTAYTVTWPSVTWVGGSAPTLATTGWTIVELFKVGGVLYGANVGNVA